MTAAVGWGWCRVKTCHSHTSGFDSPSVQLKEQRPTFSAERHPSEDLSFFRSNPSTRGDSRQCVTELPEYRRGSAV